MATQANTTTRIAQSVNQLLFAFSEFLAPKFIHPATPHTRDRWRLCILAVLAASLFVKTILIVNGSFMLTRADGVSRLFIAMDRFGDPTYLPNLKTWGELPLIIPQIYYSILFALDKLSGGALDVTKTVLFFNALAYAGATWFLSIAMLRTLGGLAGAATCLLLTAAVMPGYYSLTAAVEPISVLFAALAIYFAVRALSEEHGTWMLALKSSIFILLASTFRLEFFTLAPMLSGILLHRIGILRSVFFVVVAGLFLIFQYAIAFLVSDLVAYSDISKHYPSIKYVPFKTLLKTNLIQAGALDTWTAFGGYAALLSGVVGLFFKSTRFWSTLALISFAIIISAAMIGKITAGQERYIMLPMMLLAMPMAGLLQVSAARLNGRVPPKIKPGLALAFAGLALTLSIAQFQNFITKRMDQPDIALRSAQVYLTAHAEQGDVVFTDMTFYNSFPLAIHAYALTGELGYSYQSKSQVSEAAIDVLGADEAHRLTRDRSAIIPHLSIVEKFDGAFQIWSAGFIDEHQPRFFVALTGRWRENWRRNMDRAGVKHSSFIYPHISQIGENDAGEPVYAGTPDFGRTPLCLVEKYQNEMIVIFEGFYPPIGDKLAKECAQLL